MRPGAQGRRTNFFWHPVLPHKCGVPLGYGTPHLCGSEEFCRAPVALSVEGRIQDWNVDSHVRAFLASDEVRADKAVRAPVSSFLSRTSMQTPLLPALRANCSTERIGQ